MAQCQRCGCEHSGYGGVCGACRLKEQLAQQDEAMRCRVDEVRKTDPSKASKMWREYQAAKEEARESVRKGGTYFVPIVVIIVVVASLVGGAISFGKGVYMRFANEAGAMSVVRDEKIGNFVKKGKPIAEQVLPEKKAALKAVMASGLSYRMEGSFRYGLYKSGSKNTLRTSVEMSYNGNLDMYKFVLESDGGNDILDKRFRIADGTYYIVQEGGKIYVLSDCSGNKKAVDVSADAVIYNFLMAYRMETMIYTSVIDKVNQHYTYRDAEFYRRTYPNTGYMIYPYPKTELRVYKDKPVTYLHRIKNDDDIECFFSMKYFYDEIPVDAPSVASFQ